MNWMFYLVAGGIGALYFGFVLLDILLNWPQYQVKQAKRGIRASKNVQIAAAVAMIIGALFSAYLGVIKFRDWTPETPKETKDEVTISSVINSFIEAENRVEISHRILIEAFSKLDYASTPDQFVMILKSDVYRCLNAEALHCQRAVDKISSINDSLLSSKFDSATRRELSEIMGTSQDAYLTRKSALLKTASAIEAMNLSANKKSSTAVKRAVAEMQSGQEKIQKAAFLFAAFCSKHGIQPAQK